MYGNAFDCAINTLGYLSWHYRIARRIEKPVGIDFTLAVCNPGHSFNDFKHCAEIKRTAQF